MTTYFAGTSAIAKRYINEIGSKWILRLSHPLAGNVFVLSKLTTVEMASVLRHAVNAGILAQSAEVRLTASFLLDADNQYLTFPIDETVQHDARRLIRQHGLRTLDAIQLSNAVQASQYLGEPLIFLSADSRLLAAASAEGFAVDNPNLHP